LDGGTIEVGTGASSRSIAVRYRAGGNPGLVWLGGFRSDMLGAKAETFDQWCVEKKLAFCRHDYSGHGQSGGAFRDGNLSRWIEESLAVFDAITAGEQVLIGSSMGAWIALRMAQELARRGDAGRLHAMLLIAPAPDFTHELIMPQLTRQQRDQLEGQGFIEEPSPYSDDPTIYTRTLFEDGAANRVLTGPVRTQCPVHIIQGMADPDVPWRHAMKLAELLPDENVSMTLVKDGDHRLSRPQDLALMLRLAEDLLRRQ
jgi:pimeloyl-ACP methyl ester carboxylesterase